MQLSMYEVVEEIEIQDDSEITKPYYGVYTNGNTDDYEDDYEEEEYTD